MGKQRALFLLIIPLFIVGCVAGSAGRARIAHRHFVQGDCPRALHDVWRLENDVYSKDDDADAANKYKALIDEIKSECGKGNRNDLVISNKTEPTTRKRVSIGGTKEKDRRNRWEKEKDRRNRWDSEVVEAYSQYFALTDFCDSRYKPLWKWQRKFQIKGLQRTYRTTFSDKYLDDMFELSSKKLNTNQTYKGYSDGYAMDPNRIEAACKHVADGFAYLKAGAERAVLEAERMKNMTTRTRSRD
jgi:hypothetical protein